MTTDYSSPPIDRRQEFQSSIADLVLEAFAAGVDVEGSWLIESPVADAPSWLLSISKVPTEKENGYEPSLIEE